MQLQNGIKNGSQEFESLLNELISCSKMIIDAVCDENIDEIGRLLEMRKRQLNALVENQVPKGDRTTSAQAAIDEASMLDKQIVKGLSEYAKRSGLDIAKYQKKTVGLLRYNNGDYDLTQGKLLDRKR